MREDVSDIEHKARIELETALLALKEKKEKLTSSKQHLENVIKHASDLQTFFALRQTSSEITTTKTFLQSIIDNGHLDTLILGFCVDEHFRNILEKVKTFGSIRTEKSPCNLNLVIWKQKEAQLVGVHSTFIQDINVKLTQTVTTDIRQITGREIMPDGKLIFCHYHLKRLVVIDDKHVFEVPVPRGAFDVRCISDQTVAVSTGCNQPYGINIIDISIRKTLRFLSKNYSCWGITSVNRSLVYCIRKMGIEMMDFNSENTTTIVRCVLPSWSYIASYFDKLYYTNSSTNTVTCCDMKGNTLWTFKDETVLRYPYGISVDNDGHVFVVGNKCTSVVTFSVDGQQNRQILSKEDDLNDPAAIHYDKSRKQLLIANYNSTAFLFEMSS